MNNKISLGWLLLSLPLAALAADPVTHEEVSSAAQASVAEGHRHTRIYADIPPQGLGDYVRDADEIVRGLVTGQRAVFPPTGLPYTEVDLWVLSAVKGSAGRMIRVRIAGARGVERNVEVQGAPRFVEGEEALLFLMRFTDRNDGREYHGIRGLDQGTYRMPLDPSAGSGVIGLHAQSEGDLAEFERRVALLNERLAKGGAK